MDNLAKHNLLYRAIRKIWRLINPPLSEEEKKQKKQLQDYQYLISRGVTTELGNVTLFGEPLIYVSPGAKVVLGKNVMIISDSQYNRAGINHPTILSAEVPGAEIVIGDGVGLSGSSIVAIDKIEIKNNVMLGANTNIYDNDFHPINSEKRKNQRGMKDVLHAPILIGEDCWIGAGTTILKGVQVGEKTVIGAMSLVTKSIPKNVIAGGVPAKVIHEISGD